MTVPSAVWVVSTPDPELIPEATQLARQLDLLCRDWTECRDEAVLVVTTTGLELQIREKGRGNPVSVDFSANTARERRQEGLRQTLARAIGLKPGVRPAIFDATPGLGRDAFVLAALGCRVTMMERSPVVHALLADGLRRAALQDLPECTRLTLLAGDARLHLTRTTPSTPSCDVIYLDPMHPERTKSALVKKEMRHLRTLVGDDADANELLHAAWQRAGQRVVVKRPRLALPLANQTPHAVVTGQSVRYDLYFTTRPLPD